MKPVMGKKGKLNKDQAVNPTPQPVPLPPPAAYFQIAKLADGSTQYNYGGCESDVLGLLHYGTILVEEKTKMNIALAAQRQAQEAMAAMQAKQNPPPGQL